MKALNKLLKNKKTIVFLDFEGTQFTHEIIAWGAIKCHIDEDGNIIDKDDGFLAYVTTKSTIGSLITKMTGITKDLLSEKGVSLEKAIEQFISYLNEDISGVAFLTFGSSDCKMLHDSINFSNPANAETGREICKNMIDYMAFLSQFIRDSQGNPYSLTNYLKLFEHAPCGISHNPLNDSIDLMNLYTCFLNQKELVLKQYLCLLSSMKIFPQPVKVILENLINGNDVTSKDFIDDVKTFLS